MANIERPAIMPTLRELMLVRPKKGECQEYSQLYWGRQIAPNPLVLASNKFYIVFTIFRKAVIDRGFLLFQREKEVDKTRSRRTILFPGTRGTTHACTKRPTPCYSKIQKPQSSYSFQSRPHPLIIHQLCTFSVPRRRTTRGETNTENEYD